MAASLAELLRSPAARLLPWLALYLCALLGGRLSYYIAPWQHWIIWATAAAFLALWLSSFKPAPLGQREPRLSLAEALEGLAHWVPLLLLLLIGPADLSATASFSPRPLPSAAPAQLPPASEDAPPPGGLPYPESSFLELYTLGPVADGMQARLLGRFRPLEKSADLAARARSGGIEPRACLYRYAITCCAADGQLLAAILENSPLPGWAQPDYSIFSDGDWVEVQGEAHYVEADSPVLVIEVHQIWFANPPSEPYEYALIRARNHD